jgi:FixJ family two-component response regulator
MCARGSREERTPPQPPAPAGFLSLSLFILGQITCRTINSTQPAIARSVRIIHPGGHGSNAGKHTMATEADRLTVFIVGDDVFKMSVARLFRNETVDVRRVSSNFQFGASNMSDTSRCIVLDARRPGISVLQFQSELRRARCEVPLVCVTDDSDISTPPAEPLLLAAVRSALLRDAQRRESEQSADQISGRYSTLTSREREVVARVGGGLMNKQIAGELGIAEITVKVHRGNANRKLGARSFADLIRMADVIKQRTALTASGMAAQAA